MKNILLLVHDDTGQEARFQAALDLTRALDGHLTCIDVAVPPLAMGGDYGSAAGQGILIDLERAREAKNRTEIERRLAGEAVSWNWVDALDTIDHAVLDAAIRWDWLDVTEDPAFALIERAALADLVILGQPDSEAGKARALVADVAVTVRAPVLVVPQHLRTFDCSGAALVAWNGSMEAAHALRAALPLLVRAASVRIATVADDNVRLPAKAAAEYLSRHGVHAEICDWQRGTGRISDALLDGAKAAGGAYLVAGAYGHTRFREAILGGVTRELLEAASLPLLLTH